MDARNYVLNGISEVFKKKISVRFYYSGGDFNITPYINHHQMALYRLSFEDVLICMWSALKIRFLKSNITIQ